jgi:hypothetical protein
MCLPAWDSTGVPLGLGLPVDDRFLRVGAETGDSSETPGHLAFLGDRSGGAGVA